MNVKPAMIRKCLWPVCLMGLFITGIFPLNCKLLSAHLSRVTWQNLRLLTSMSNSFPAECIRERKDFELPQEVLSYTQPMKRNIKEAFYEIYMKTFSIFIQYTSIPSWEEKHLKQIQLGLDWQLQYLEQCLEEKKENEDMEEMEEDEIKHSGTMDSQLSNLELKKYFNRIGNFLKEKQYSYCAWKIVLVEIRRCFYYLQKFTALLGKK